MTDHADPSGDQAADPSGDQAIVVHYWAAARAAAGASSDTLPVTAPMSLSDVLATVRAVHADRPRLADVIAVCSVLIGEQPVGAREPSEVMVHPGQTVELLPPFAGG